MKNVAINQVLVWVLVSSLTVIAGGCSSDEPEAAKSGTVANTAKPAKKENKIDYGEASDSVKNKFIKTFAQNCVARELKNSANPDVDEPRFQQSCGCIAEHIAEDLAEVDAEKYLDDHEDTHTLQIKFDSAAYFCLQNKAQPKGPHLFGKQ